jgi:hypothetical protein
MINLLGWLQPVAWPLQGFGSAGLATAEVADVRRLPMRGTVFELERQVMNYSNVTARDPIIKHPSDAGVFVLGFDGVLPASESIDDVELLDVELVAGDGPNNLIASDAEATSEAYETTWGDLVPAGRGVRFTLSDGTAGCTYKVTLVVTSESGTIKAGAVFVELHA